MQQHANAEPYGSNIINRPWSSVKPAGRYRDLVVRVQCQVDSQSGPSWPPDSPCLAPSLPLFDPWSAAVRPCLAPSRLHSARLAHSHPVWPPVASPRRYSSPADPDSRRLTHINEQAEVKVNQIIININRNGQEEDGDSVSDS